MIKLFCAFLFIFSLAAANFSQQAVGDAGSTKKIAFINSSAFEDTKTGIKKLVAAHEQVGIGSVDCFPSPCGEKVWQQREKKFVEPVMNEIRQSLKQIEAQNNVLIIDVYELDKNNLILAYDEKFTITTQFIDYFNDKRKNPAAVLKLDAPTPQIAFIDTSLFENEKTGLIVFTKLMKKFGEEFDKALTEEFGAAKPDINSEAFKNFAFRYSHRSENYLGKEMAKISKAIQTFAIEKRIAFIFDPAKKLPVELGKYPAPDVTKEFISYYNQINP